MNIEERAAYAKRILSYYFQLAWEKAGLRWDSDNQAEIESAIDDILAVAGAGHVGDVPVSASEPNPPKAGR